MARLLDIYFILTNNLLYLHLIYYRGLLVNLYNLLCWLLNWTLSKECDFYFCYMRLILWAQNTCALNEYLNVMIEFIILAGTYVSWRMQYLSIKETTWSAALLLNYKIVFHKQ